MVDALRPAYDVAVRLPGNLVENMVRAQVRLDVAELKADPLIAGLIADRGLLVVGGRYDLTSGAVEIIADQPRVPASLASRFPGRRSG